MNKFETLGVPLKKASDVDILKPLKNLISSRYQTSEQESYIISINELSKLRSSAVVKTLDFHESSLDLLYRYYDQIVALETKIPASEFQVPFKWKDAFDKGSIFGGRISLTISSLSYEKVCVLFNIAAMQSQIAANQTSDSDESMKLAAKLYQSASGIFNHLKSIVHGSLQQDPTPDLQPETLTALSCLMLAQAQEVIAIKARSDKMKDAVVAKLFNQCEENYTETVRSMQKEVLKPLWDRDWLSKVHSKQIAFQALAQYHQSKVCNSTKAVGEEIARLKQALELFKSAQTRSGEYNAFSDDIGRAQRAHDEAVKDNDFIYHERVPDAKNLEPIGKFAVAKQSPMPSQFSSNFHDLFNSLVPVVIQQALVQYGMRKSEIVNTEVSKLRESTQLLNSILASLNLPAAIEEKAGEKVPQSIKDKTNAVCAKGGIKKINSFLEELPDLLTRNRELLDECERQLKEEKRSDDQLRAQFKEKWTRTPSEKLTNTFVTNSEKYRKVIETAMEADQKIRSKLNTNKKGIVLLSEGVSSIATEMPNVATNSVKNSSGAAKLKTLMREVETLKAEREAIESELKSSETDMKNVFLGALAEDGVINEPTISVQSLGRVYGPLQQQVKSSLSRQEELVKEIQQAHTEFSGGHAEGGDRETLLKSLATAHDTFLEILSNLEEGTKFYNDLTHLLVNFQSKINDFCFARRTEKEELMNDLTSGIANQNIGSTPAPPVHHQEVTQGQKDKSTPPARPPPPQANPYQGAPQGFNFSQNPPPYNPIPQQPGALPYPLQPQGMPTPQSTNAAAPPPQGGYPYPNYPVYTPMPQGFNPYYAQAPYPQQTPYPGYQYPPQNPPYPPTS